MPPLTYVPFYEDPIENLSQFILPAISISVFTLAIVMRMVRATMLEVLGRTTSARRGPRASNRRTVISRHALRNALIPVVTIVGFEIGMLMGGAAIVEIIFGLPGVGYTLLQAIFNRDYPVIQAATLLHRRRLHLRQPARRHPLRRPRPEDHAGMSQGDYDPPVLAPEGAGDAGAGSGHVPTRRGACLGKWRNPIGLVGAGIVGFNVFVALFGQFIWTIDPDELVADRLQAPSWAHPMGTDELGRDTLRADHPRRPGLAAGRAHLGRRSPSSAGSRRAARRLLRGQASTRC